MIRNTKKQLEINQAVATLDDKGKLQYLLMRDIVKMKDDEQQMFSTKLSQFVSSTDSFTASFKGKSAKDYKRIEQLFGSNLVFETKYRKLLQTINIIEVGGGKNVITVFVSWIHTLHVLKARLKKAGYWVAEPISGETKPAARKAIINYIKEKNKTADDKKIIFLVSRVGNEGLDFDEFSNRVIHYDNNFNPAVIDQRNGRVYRNTNLKKEAQGVTFNDIKVYQLFLEETYDQRILFIEKEKRKFKDFYLGDGTLEGVLKKTLQKQDLSHNKELVRILESIKIDLTPNKMYLMKKYKNEV